jgi:chromosome partitioning protein
MGFAESLGVIINIKDPHSPEDEHFDHWLRQNPEHRCFHQSIPLATPLQATRCLAPRFRSHLAKYPGSIGNLLRNLTSELLSRLAAPRGETATSLAPAESVTSERRPKRGEGMMKAMWASWKDRRMP